MQEIGTLIIGAGVSGLTYAANCEEDYLLVEKESNPGGLCRTFYRGEYIWDFAGHFFHFANEEIKQMFESAISKDDMVNCKKNTNINYNGNQIDYPFQMNIHQLPKKEFIDCLYDLYHREEKDHYQSFEDMLYGKFGVSITNKFLKPYNEKLYACNLNELDTDAMGRFFPYANPEQIINNMKKNNVSSYNSYFEYPKKGAQFFIDILVKKIDQKKMMLNKCVEKIDIPNNIAIINGEQYHYKKLINTMPLNQFIKIIPETYIEIVGDSLTCNKVLVFNLGFDKKALCSRTHWTYFPMKSVNFYRVGYYNNILGTDNLSMYIEIGFKEDANIDVEYQLNQTLDNLRMYNIIDEHQLVEYNALIINPGYVHITSDSIDKVKSLRNVLEKNNIYTIGRYGGWTYCSIEDCMLEAMQLAKMFKTS